MAHELRAILRLVAGKEAQPSAAVVDGCTLQSSCESGPRVGYDGYKRRKGSKVHVAVDTLGHLLALKVTAVGEQERVRVGELMTQVQPAAGGSVQVAFADQGYTGAQPSQEAAQQGVNLELVKLSEAKKGFMLLSKCWEVQRTFGLQARSRRLSRDYERLPNRPAGLNWLAAVFLMLNNLF